MGSMLTCTTVKAIRFYGNAGIVAADWSSHAPLAPKHSWPPIGTLSVASDMHTPSPHPLCHEGSLSAIHGPSRITVELDAYPTPMTILHAEPDDGMSAQAPDR